MKYLRAYPDSMFVASPSEKFLAEARDQKGAEAALLAVEHLFASRTKAKNFAAGRSRRYFPDRL